MTVNTEARDKEKRREAFLASQVPLKCEYIIINFGYNLYFFFFSTTLKHIFSILVSDNESEHDNEEEEWEAQQIRKGVTGAQVNVIS